MGDEGGAVAIVGAHALHSPGDIEGGDFLDDEGLGYVGASRSSRHFVVQWSLDGIKSITTGQCFREFALLSLADVAGPESPVSFPSSSPVSSLELCVERTKT